MLYLCFILKFSFSRNFYILQENLINGDNRDFTIQDNLNHGPSYVIRLDTIPVFNPHMINGVDYDMKPINPPPSYEQVCSFMVNEIILWYSF